MFGEPLQLKLLLLLLRLLLLLLCLIPNCVSWDFIIQFSAITQCVDDLFIRFRNDHNEWGDECLKKRACDKTEQTERQICVK